MLSVEPVPLVETVLSAEPVPLVETVLSVEPVPLVETVALVDAVESVDCVDSLVDSVGVVPTLTQPFSFSMTSATPALSEESKFTNLTG